ncbi:MAG: LysR substrate-binding domain-containing protein [Polyangiaceae bacterium]
MDLRHVEVLAAVVEHGSISAAARALGLPKSSISRAVSLLEASVGSRLLQRLTRGISLTETGSAFFEKAARGLEALAEAREEVASRTAEMAGRVRVTAPPDVGAWLLAPVIAAFAAEHPKVQVECELQSRVLGLAEGGFDLALRARGVADESLVARKLRPIRFGLYASRAYLDAHGAPRRPSDLARHRCVLFRGASGRASWALHGPKGAQTVAVSGVISGDEFVYLREAVAAGAGIGLLPEFVAHCAGHKPIERVLPRFDSPIQPLFLVYPSGRYLPRRVAALRDTLLRELG